MAALGIQIKATPLFVKILNPLFHFFKGASSKEVNSASPAAVVLTNGVGESSPRLNAANSLDQPELNPTQVGFYSPLVLLY